MSAPKVLNGYPVIWSKAVARDQQNGRLIIAFRANYESDPFVIAYWNPGYGSSWSSGDYVRDLDEALAIFNKRLARLA